MTGASSRTSSVNLMRSPVIEPGVYIGSPVRTMSSSAPSSPSTIAYLGSPPVVNRAMRMSSRVVRHGAIAGPSPYHWGMPSERARMLAARADELLAVVLERADAARD